MAACDGSYSDDAYGRRRTDRWSLLAALVLVVLLVEMAERPHVLVELLWLLQLVDSAFLLWQLNVQFCIRQYPLATGLRPSNDAKIS